MAINLQAAYDQERSRRYELEAENAKLKAENDAWERYWIAEREKNAELQAENAKLKELLLRYRNETPLGHQPHMIAHEVDAALEDK